MAEMTLRSNHTPGSWEVHVGSDVTGYPCYFIHGFSGDQKRDVRLHDANARLIAAAPDLLAACKLIVSFAKSWEPLTPGDIRVITDAIALAEEGR
jgi:hypothetical protein